MSQFNFGSNLSTNTSAPAPAFPFGAQTSATPTFRTLNTGTQPSGSITFGTPIASVAPVNQNTSLTLGAAPTLGTGLAFGTPAKTTALSFGAQPAFGTTSTAPTVSFGNTAASTAPGLTFGAAPVPAPAPIQNPLANISFATPSTTNLSLGSTPNPLAGINFNTTAPSSLSLTTPSAAPALNFKSSLTPATAPTLNFGFNPPAKTQITTPVVTTASIGLGGVDNIHTKPGTVQTTGSDTITGKENHVPNEILQSIESFKQFVKDQKSHSSDVSRSSARPLVKVREDIDLIQNILTDVSNELKKNQQNADKLKHDSAKCLRDAEMAQRTNDTPPGLQFENTAPLRYFVDLVNQFEQDLQTIRDQIDVTDKHFQSLYHPKFLTSQELATGMHRLHDTFVALAGRLHSVHTQVESQKEQYLNLRKYILKDPTNVFEKPATKEDLALDQVLKGLSANKSVSGPTPFSSFGPPFPLTIMQAQQTVSKPPPAYPTNTSTFNFPSNTNNLNATGTQLLFGSAQSTGPLQSVNDTPAFQLQNPPLGNKRGKR